MDFLKEAGGWLKQITKSLLGLVAIVLVAGLVGLLIFRIAAVNFVDNYELGYKYDLRTGKIERLNRTGYFVTWPIVVKVHTVDLRPMQVRISAINRVLNAKLVQFNPEGLELFLSWHGRNDYSIEGSKDSSSQFNEILMAYAYEGSGKNYPFLTVIRELSPGEINDANLGK
jgi:hypothetical protein